MLCVFSSLNIKALFRPPEVDHSNHVASRPELASCPGRVCGFLNSLLYTDTFGHPKIPKKLFTPPALGGLFYVLTIIFCPR